MKKSVKFLVPLFLLVLFFNSSIRSQEDTTKEEAEMLKIMRTITSEELYSYVDTLSSDVFEGRLTGHIGYDRSAEWIIKKFKEWDVKPLGTDGGFLQQFPHPYSDVFEGCVLKMLDKKGEVIKDYEYVEDFIPGSTSGNGDVKAEVVYIGYGISAPELGYDDYSGVDVKGKIVLVEREVPVKEDNENFLKWRPFSFHQYKLLNAVKHGAVGFLYNYHIANPNMEYNKGIVLSYVGTEVVKDIFEGTLKEHDSIVKKIKETLKPQSFNTGKVFYIKNNTKYHPDGIGSNVIGYIEGSDPKLKDEYLILGAHLDHLGKCYTIMPGAHDNASAVSVSLGIAHAMSKLDHKSKRSVIFIMIGAEEAALKGVQYFLKNPTIPLENIVGYINMDGVGIGNQIKVGFAENYPTFYSYLKLANDNHVQASMIGRRWANIARPRQDAAFFDWYGIPTLTLGSSGDMPQNKNYRYHTPYDNITNITPEIMKSISDMLFLSIVSIANEEKIEFKRGDKKTEFINGYDFHSVLEKK